MFEQLASGTAVTIDSARCLNSRHDRAGCRRCIDVCPTDAIVLAGHLPSLAVGSCVQCGACTPACPTDAVVSDERPERRLVEACDALDAPAITLACALHPHPVASQANGVVVRHSRCLAALDPDRLLAVSRDTRRSVSLDLSWCVECPIAAAVDGAVDNVEATNALVSMATGEVVTPIGVRRLPAGEAPETASNSGSGVVDSQRPSLTRRGMFTSLRRRVTSTVERFNATVPLPLRRSKGPVTNRLPQAVPPSRQHLLDRLATIGAASDVSGSTCRVSAVAAPVADVRVDAHRCSGCGMCARYCPTGALAFSMSTSSDDIATTFALALRTSLCIDCGICAVACPEQAISYGEEITATSFGAPEWATVASGPLIDCTACGLPTAASVDSRCFSCRLGTGVVTALRDDAGLMADLLARSPADPVR